MSGNTHRYEYNGYEMNKVSRIKPERYDDTNPQYGEAHPLGSVERYEFEQLKKRVSELERAIRR